MHVWLVCDILLLFWRWRWQNEGVWKWGCHQRGGGVADLVRKFVLNSHFLSLCSWLARFHTHWSVRTPRAAERVSLTPHSPLISPPWFQPSWSYDLPPNFHLKVPQSWLIYGAKSPTETQISPWWMCLRQDLWVMEQMRRWRAEKQSACVDALSGLPLHGSRISQKIKSCNALINQYLISLEILCVFTECFPLLTTACSLQPDDRLTFHHHSQSLTFHWTWISQCPVNFL